VKRVRKSRYTEDLYRYGAILFLIWLVGIGVFRIQRDQNIQELKTQSLKELHKQFNAAQSPFDKLSLKFYNDNNIPLSDMLYRAQHSSNPQKWREKILDRFYEEFENAKLFGLTEFYLYTKDGNEFCSFHRRSITHKSSPHSVQKVIKTARFLKGFEAQRVEDGLRYFYPLFYEGKFVGLYEWVWSLESLIRELRKIDDRHYLILTIHQSGESNRSSKIVPLPSCPQVGPYRKHLALYGGSFAQKFHKMATEIHLCHMVRSAKDQAKIYRDDTDQDQLIQLLALPDLSLSKSLYGYLFALSKEARISELSHLFYLEVVVSGVVLLMIFMLLYHSSWESSFVRTIIDTQQDLIILINNDRIIDANRAFLDFFDVESLEEFLVQYGCISTFFIPQKGYLSRRPSQGEHWLNYLRKHPRQTRVLMYDRHRGENRIFIAALNPFDESDLCVISFRDITELDQERHQFKVASMLDHLTQAYNKRTFEEYLRNRLETLQRSENDEVTLVMFDIDHFKKINDRYGHLKGDEVLKNLTKLVQEHIRKEDFLARWGGEEFMIVMDAYNLEMTCHKIDELRRLISESSLGVPEKITCSFGVTMLHIHDTFEEAVARVDQLLYLSKEQGRNRVTCQ